MEDLSFILGIASLVIGIIWLRVLMMSDKSEYEIGAKILGADLIYGFGNFKKCWFPLLLIFCGFASIFIGKSVS